MPTKNPFLLTKADIISTRGGILNVIGNVIEIVIYENIELPYLTGEIHIADDAGYYERLNPTGSDIIQIELSDFPDASITAISKKFVMNKLINLSKDTQGQNVMVFSIMELHGWVDSLINANIVVTGTRRDMIGQIAKTFLPRSKAGTNYFKGLEVSYGTEEYVDVERQFIVPSNMTPLQACKVIKDEDSTIDGYPYFLFSALGNPGLKYISLKEILDNQQKHLTFIPPNGQWVSNKTYDYSSLARKGTWGSDHMYWDPNLGLNNAFGMDWSEESGDEVSIPDDLSKIPTIRNVRYLPRFTFDGLYSIGEQLGTFKSRPYAKSLMNILATNSVDVQFDEARYFLSGSIDPRVTESESSYRNDEQREAAEDGKNTYNSLTLGKKITLKFKSSFIKTSGEIKPDPNLSGSYFIYAAKFIFKRNENVGFTSGIRLTCTRVFTGDKSIDTKVDEIVDPFRITDSVHDFSPKVEERKTPPPLKLPPKYSNPNDDPYAEKDRI